MNTDMTGFAKHNKNLNLLLGYGPDQAHDS